MKLLQNINALQQDEAWDAGSDVLRIVPPLVITKEHIDKMAAILDECME